MGAESGSLTGPVHTTVGATELLTVQARTACWLTPTTGAFSSVTTGGSTVREGGREGGREGSRERGKERERKGGKEGVSE